MLIENRLQSSAYFFKAQKQGDDFFIKKDVFAKQYPTYHVFITKSAKIS